MTKFCQISSLQLSSGSVYSILMHLHTGRCPALSLENGRTDYTAVSAGGMYPTDTTAFLYCNYPDYSRVGSSSRTCQQSGIWTGQTTTCIQGKNFYINTSV